MSVTIMIPERIDPVDAPEGDRAGVETLATTVFRNASRFTGFAEEASELAESKWYWTGSAADAYGTHAARFATRHATMGETLKRVGQGIDHFSEQLREAETAHKDLTSRISSFHACRGDLRAKVDGAGEVTEAEIAQLQEESRQLSTTRDTIVSDIARFQQQVTANEQALVQLFTRTDTAGEATTKNAGIDPVALGAIGRMPSSEDGPDAMAEWWKSLSAEEQEALIAAYPDRLGAADGLPAGARDDANRISMARDIAVLTEREADGTLTEDEKQVLENARKAQEALKTADDYVMPGTNDRPGGQLWLYDPDAFGGDGRVAIAVGDLDTADDVAVSVPGIKTEMTGAPGGVRDAANLYESARYNGDGSSVATMFWLGYDTPDEAWDSATLTEGRAADGGERLATAVEGLRASRAGDPAHMTAVGHSYGSTTTAYAATDHDLAVDDVALIGSPGAGPADHASDFSVGADHVYDGRNSHDPVAFLGDEGWARKSGLFGAGLGVDPSSEDFGAHRFEAEAIDRQSYPLTDRHLDDHSKYYTPDSESLYNLGRIVDGHGGDVNTAEHSYDPWYRAAVDPEKDRTPTSDVPGRSDTGTGIS